ncbi:nicotinamide-nucleotide amidase [Oceanospirillum multiglobuliferum]|uniref:CinA family protein n=1 Tax=Oceanospirillum multiglobuliferum TaxID=64969 RepID=UPI0009CCAFB1|nr:CinA family protein [Oceanospirillum multiglobuliferum]SKA05768.1 nicotinamide-nucleotide amidase [Oceanospirillum multiglobuliferum]
MSTTETIFSTCQRLATLLISRQQMVATAESCTGGGIATALTDLAGSSTWFDAGFVTYSNQAKQRMLAVPESVLIEHGAVSQPVVEAMVRGAIAHSQAQFAVAVSGVAGPSGGSADKPVGTVWIAWGDANTQQSQRFQFSGDRQQVRAQTILAALLALIEFIQFAE